MMTVMTVTSGMLTGKAAWLSRAVITRRHRHHFVYFLVRIVSIAYR